MTLSKAHLLRDVFCHFVTFVTFVFALVLFRGALLLIGVVATARADL